MDQDLQREPGEMPQRNMDASRPTAMETVPTLFREAMEEDVW